MERVKRNGGSNDEDRMNASSLLLRVCLLHLRTSSSSYSLVCDDDNARIGRR